MSTAAIEVCIRVINFIADTSYHGLLFASNRMLTAKCQQQQLRYVSELILLWILRIMAYYLHLFTNEYNKANDSSFIPIKCLRLNVNSSN